MDIKKPSIREIFTGFFTESDGSYSSQRLVFVMGSVYAMVMGALVYYSSHDYIALIATVPALATVFMAGKLIQKQEEIKPKDDENGGT